MACVLEVTDSSFEEVLHSNDIVFAYFYGDNCQNCIQATPLFEEASEENEKAVFIKTNLVEAPNAFKTNIVLSVPTIILFKDGREQKRITGKLTIKDILTITRET
ncbi:MAG: thioredoxin family protein [Candidatus Altiarchaeota archaeon]